MKDRDDDRSVPPCLASERVVEAEENLTSRSMGPGVHFCLFSGAVASMGGRGRRGLELAARAAGGCRRGWPRGAPVELRRLRPAPFEVALSGSGLEPGGLLLQAAPDSDVDFGKGPLRGNES